MPDNTENNPGRVIIELLRKFGTLSFRHLRAITELSVMELNRILQELLAYGKILKTVEMTPKEGLLTFYEAIETKSNIIQQNNVPENKSVPGLADTDFDDEALSTPS